MRYAHDLINVSLDKPIHDPEAIKAWTPYAEKLGRQLANVHQNQTPKARERPNVITHQRAAPKCRFDASTFDTNPGAVSRFMRDLGKAQKAGNAESFVRELNGLCSTRQARLPLTQSCPEIDYRASIDDRMNGAVCRSLDAFARGKYWMGGYHAANWVNLNKTLPGLGRQKALRTPFAPIVQAAQAMGYGKGKAAPLDENDFGDRQLQLMQDDPDPVKISGKCSGTECSLTATAGGKTIEKQPRIKVPITDVTHQGVRRAVKEARDQLRDAMGGKVAPRSIEPEPEPVFLEPTPKGLGGILMTPEQLEADIAEIRERTKKKRKAAEPEEPRKERTTFAQIDGERIDLVLRPVALTAVLPSTNPQTFESELDYPGWLQPRDRGRAANVAQIRSMAANLKPRQLIDDFHTLDRGAPVVVEGRGNGLFYVVSGNGRAMAIKLAAYEYPEVYREYLETLQEQLDIPPKGVKNLPPNMLVRVLPAGLSQERVREIAELGNVSAAIATSSVEQAAIDTTKMSGEFIGRLEPMDDETATLADTVSAAKNREWTTQFLGMIPETQLAGMVSPDGSLNNTGVERAVMALTMWTFGVEDNGRRLAEFAFEALTGDAKNIMQGTLRAVPRLASMRSTLQGYVINAGPETKEQAEVQQSMDITPLIAQSILRYIKIKASGQPLDEALAQASFDDPIYPMERTMLTMFETNKRSARAIGEFFNAYAARVEALPNPNQASMLDTGKVQRGDAQLLLDRLVTAAAETGRSGATLQGGMFELSNKLIRRYGHDNPSSAMHSCKSKTTRLAVRRRTRSRTRVSATR